MIENYDIICFSTLDWDSHWGTMHQVMSRLVKYNRIIFVEPDVFYFEPILDNAHETEWKKAKAGLRQTEENIFLYKPFRFFPYRVKFTKSGDYLNQCLISFGLKKQLRRLKFHKPILWFFSALEVSMVYHINNDLIIYHCVDEFGCLDTEGSRLWQNKEQRLLSFADLVFTTSRNLCAAKKSVHPETFFIPNGVNAEYFIRIAEMQNLIPADLRSIPHPIVGFAGSFDKQINIPLIKLLAVELPEYSFVFIGVVKIEQSKISELMHYKNVYFLGSKACDQVPYYLKNFDICIMPYLTPEHDKRLYYAYPLKMHEYFAIGKPVISSHIPSVEEFSHILKIARNDEEWVFLIKNTSMNHHSYELQSLQKKVARENDWNNRINKISDIISQTLIRDE